MNGLILGLDIGVGSVGVGIIDKETGNIIHANSHIFPAAVADKNVERRTFRSARRLGRRKKHRIERLNDLFDSYGIVTDFSDLPLNLNPYELRVKGLTEKLTFEELYVALKNINKRRGISYLDDAEDDSGSGSAYKAAVELNQKLLSSQTPGQIQLDRLNRYGQVRGDFEILNEKGQKERLINVFSTSAYAREASIILNKQKEFYPQITDEFIEDYLSVLTAKRKYYHGPGSKKSRTDYGRFKLDGTDLDNLFEILIGKCTFYPDEYRAAKASYTAQEFNILNDLNNLIVPTETKKLSEEDKRQIIAHVKSSKAMGGPTLLKYIAKLVDGDPTEIKGYRQDKKDNPEFHTFEGYRKFKNLQSIVVDELDRDTYDQLAHILTINTDREGIEEAIKKDLPQFTDEQITELISFRRNNGSVFNAGWHSFSEKLMKELIPEMYATSDEQMTVLRRLGKRVERAESPRSKYIDEKLITDEIYNPVVAKAVRRAIKIVNVATKKYGVFDQIVIEMARDKNEDEAKKKIQDAQKANKTEKEAAEKAAAKDFNGKDELPDSIFHGHKQLALKIRLWHQQGKRSLYSGKPIDIHDLIANPNLFEVDHILPLSLSFDDSLANKVLVYAVENQDKGQQTPFQYMPQIDGAWSFNQMKAYVSGLKNFSRKKKEYLFTDEDIANPAVRTRFIQRNLVDTRYASKVVLNALQDFYRERDYDTKVSVVRGQFTSQLRRKWFIQKSRDTFHHHAIDACIIAASTQLKLWKKESNLVKYNESEFLDLTSGEIIDVNNDQYKEEVYNPPYLGFGNQLEKYDDVLFSFQVDSKVNRKISDATIYATRQAQIGKDKKEETYVLGKIKDIYQASDFQEFLKRYEKDKTQFLMYQKDPKTFEILEKIMEEYPQTELNDKNKEVACSPFEKYRQEHGYVQKYSKKGNGPTIKTLKYYDKKLGNHIDITPDDSRNKVVLQSLKPWRTDVYFNPETLKYELAGIKYADLEFAKGSGKYRISKKKYEEIKKNEGVSEKSEFKFTLYKNDLILIRDIVHNQQAVYRFSSKNDSNKHYLELKPIDKDKFKGNQQLLPFLGKVAASGQFIKGINKKDISIYKVKTDILGNKFYIKSEGDQPKLDF